MLLMKHKISLPKGASDSGSDSGSKAVVVKTTTVHKTTINQRITATEESKASIANSDDYYISDGGESKTKGSKKAKKVTNIESEDEYSSDGEV